MTNNERMIKMSVLEKPYMVAASLLDSKIGLESEAGSNLGRIPAFLLEMCGLNHTAEEISSVTGFGVPVIEDEMNYLIKSRLAIKTPDGIFELSEKGRKLFNIISKIKEFNGKEHRVLVNSVTGLIVGEDRKEDITGREIGELRSKVIWSLFSNANPSNSREFAADCGIFDGFSEDEQKEVDVSIKLSAEKAGHQVLKISRLPLLTGEEPVNKVSDNIVSEVKIKFNEYDSRIVIERTAVPFKLKAINNNFSRFDAVRDDLLSIKSKNPSLLSDEGTLAASVFEDESRLNSKLVNIYYIDTFTGFIYSNGKAALNEHFQDAGFDKKSAGKNKKNFTSGRSDNRMADLILPEIYGAGSISSQSLIDLASEAAGSTRPAVEDGWYIFAETGQPVKISVKVSMAEIL